MYRRRSSGGSGAVVDRQVSGSSLPSARSYGEDDEGIKRKNLADLPFRTVDVDVVSARVLYEQRREVGTDEDAMDVEGASGGKEERTDDGIRIDNWNKADDVSYRPYALREAINKRNRELDRRESSEMTDISETYDDEPDRDAAAARAIVVDDLVPDDERGIHLTGSSPDFRLTAEDRQTAPTPSATSAGSLTPPSSAAAQRKKKKQRIFFVCFHLPVVVRRDPSAGEWTATWAESLLAKSENSTVVSSTDARWVGTVTTDPPINRQKDREAVRSLLDGMNCTPLFLEPETIEAHYLGMCKQVLWPAFHNVDLLDLCGSGWGGSTSSPDGEGTTTAAIGNGAADGPTTTSDGSKPSSSTTTTQRRESDWDQSRLSGWWDAYRVVNRAFADALSAVLRPSDIMWVHDYHLSLLPEMVAKNEIERRGSPFTKKVFFLHIPFPTSQIFRELECGGSILEGMLSADVVGFHSFDHARHFLTAAKRILGLTYESLVGGLIGVKHMGRTVLVTMSNVSVEPSVMERALALPEVRTMKRSLRSKHPRRKIISGIDVAQRLSGVALKLLGYERLLSDYPHWKDRAVLVQRCLLPGSRKVDEAETVRELRLLVQRIRDKFGPDAIDYEEIPNRSSLPVHERLALWKATDVLVIAPIREALNLLPLEYIYARRNDDGDESDDEGPGVVVASEFSAVCSILNGALRVNPFDVNVAATVLDKALTMDRREREGRRSRDIEFVSSSPSDRWTKNVLRDLRDATAAFGGRAFDDDGEDDRRRQRDAANRKGSTDESTGAFLAREHERAFTHLDVDSVLAAYESTKRRVIVMDFNGTIVIKEPPGKYLKREILGTSGNKPPASVIRALSTLCADPRNVVFVVSGDSQENVENAVGSIPGLGLAASNGACFAGPAKPGDDAGKKRVWRTFDLGVDWAAVKKVALPVLSKFTARSNGSFVKLTHSSIGWSYYSCDPEWGALQASHLVLELEDALRAFDVRFVTLKGVVEIVPRRLNKGLIVKRVLREVAAGDGGAGVDFVLCMGDDISDEKMFTSVLSFIAEMDDDSDVSPGPPVVRDEDDVATSGGVASVCGVDTLTEEVPFSVRRKDSSGPMYAFTVAVGKKTSHASQYVDDAGDVANLLVRLSGSGGDATGDDDGEGSAMAWDSERGGDMFA